MQASHAIYEYINFVDKVYSLESKDFLRFQLRFYDIYTIWKKSLIVVFFFS